LWDTEISSIMLATKLVDMCKVSPESAGSKPDVMFKIYGIGELNAANAVAGSMD
jgi:hypothetical protein